MHLPMRCPLRSICLCLLSILKLGQCNFYRWHALHLLAVMSISAERCRGCAKWTVCSEYMVIHMNSRWSFPASRWCADADVQVDLCCRLFYAVVSKPLNNVQQCNFHNAACTPCVYRISCWISRGSPPDQTPLTPQCLIAFSYWDM